jgi:hypothetical protein
MLLTSRHDLSLLSDLLQSAQHNSIASCKAVDHVLDLRLGAELLDQCLQIAEIVARYAWEQVVHGLELQAAVNEVEPCRARDVHCCAQLALGERLSWAQVGGAGAPVGERNLHVQRHRDEVACDEEDGTGGPGRNVAPEQHVEVKEEITADGGDFGRARPPHCALSAGTARQKEAPGEDVKVETGEGHYRIVSVLLHSDSDGGDGVPDEFEAVVKGRFHGFEELWGSCKERYILDVRVVFLRDWN